MKTLILFSWMLAAMNVSANDEKFIKVMSKNIEAVYQAQTTEEFQQAINAFERVSQAEKSKWEPHYYIGFGYLMMATRERDATRKDSYLDMAKNAIDKAASLLSNDSEITALEGFVYMMKVTVDPAARGAQYSPLAMQTFGKAIGMNPNNPRALSLMAQMQFGTANFFNQPTTEACATAAKALPLFDQVPVSANALSPRWGKAMAESLISQCK